jgi:hypothetical protein
MIKMISLNNNLNLNLLIMIYIFKNLYYLSQYGVIINLFHDFL